MKIKKLISLIIILCLLIPTLISQTLSPLQVIIEWNKALIRSKKLYNIALYEIKLRTYWLEQTSLRDSLIINLELINTNQQEIIDLNERKIDNLTIVNENLMNQINQNNKGLSKLWYFVIGLTIGLIPPSLAIFLLGGK